MAYTYNILLCRDWDGIELAAMLLGSSSGPGAESNTSSGSSGAGTELSVGITLGMLGCLRDAADQQRLNRAVVMQVRCMHALHTCRQQQSPLPAHSHFNAQTDFAMAAYGYHDAPFSAGRTVKSSWSKCFVMCLQYMWTLQFTHPMRSGNGSPLREQALSVGDTDYFAVFCTQQQHQWLEAQAHSAALDAARLTDLLLGSLVDGRSLAAETYGCMRPFCQVPGLVGFEGMRP